VKSKKKETQKRAHKEAGKPVSALSIRRFAVTYLILMGVFFLLIGLKPVQDLIDLNGLYTRGVVATTTKVLGILSIPCAYQGSIIQLPSISLDVKFGCNGLESVMIYSVAVISFPASWKKKLTGILAGFVIIQAINILRIAALAYSGIHFKGVFEYIHIYVAQGIMIAISLGVFFFYLNYAKSHKEAAA